MELSFCSECGQYMLPNEDQCPHCQWVRPSYEKPMPPGQPYWCCTKMGEGPEETMFAPFPAVTEEMIVFAWNGTPDRSGLVAYDRKSGEMRWRIDHRSWSVLTGKIQTGVLAADDRIYFATRRKFAYASKPDAILGTFNVVESDTGKVVDHKELQGGVYDVPVNIPPYVFAVSSDGTALGIHQTKKIYKRIKGLPMGFLRTGAHDRFLIVSQTSGYGNSIVAADLEKESIPTQIAPAEFDYVTTSPVSNDLAIFCGTEGKDGVRRIFALRVHDSSPNLLYTMPDKQRIDHLLVSGDWLLASSANRITVISLNGARKIWSSKIQQTITSPLVSTHGVMFVGTREGKILAYKVTETPSVFGIVDIVHLGLTRSPIVSLACFKDVLYLGTEEGEVAAVPWHLWNYSQAIDALEREGLSLEAGTILVSAYNFEKRLAQKQKTFHRAIELLRGAEKYEWAATLNVYEGGPPSEIAEDFERAAKIQADRRKSSSFFMKAAEYYEAFGEKGKAKDCRQAAHDRANASNLKIEIISLQQHVEAEQEYPIILDLTNQGISSISDIEMRFSGNVVCYGWKKYLDELAKNVCEPISTKLLPMSNGVLKIEVRYFDSERVLWTDSVEQAWNINPNNTIKIKGDVGALIVSDLDKKITVEGMVGLLKLTRSSAILPDRKDFQQDNRIVAGWVNIFNEREKVSLADIHPGYKVYLSKKGFPPENKLHGSIDVELFIQKTLGIKKRAEWAIFSWMADLRLAFCVGPYPNESGHKRSILLGLTVTINEDTINLLVGMTKEGKNTLETIEIRSWMSSIVQMAVDSWFVSVRDRPIAYGEKDSLMLTLEQTVKGELRRVGLDLHREPWYYKWVDE